MGTFKIEELSGSLIKSGRFQDAIGPFFKELDEAHGWGVVTHNEIMSMQMDFCMLLTKPDAANAERLGRQMLMLALRIPGKVPFENVKFVNDETP